MTSIAGAVGSAFDGGLAAWFAHRGTVSMSADNEVAVDLELSAELAITGTTATLTGSTSVPSESRKVPSGLGLTIGGDSYTTTAKAQVQDGILTLLITPAATDTYAVGTAVVLDDAVTVDLKALDAQVEASTSKRDPAAVRTPTDHSATVIVLKSRLPGYTADTLREMRLTIDGETAIVKDAVDADPNWLLLAGGRR